MIVAISFHEGDRQLMQRWANHVVKLGPYINHKLLLIPAPGCPTKGIIEPLTRVFGEVKCVERNPVHSNEWPIPCNAAFEAAAWFVSLDRKDPNTNQKIPAWKQPFLWMEPDAIPLVSDWIDQIELEYNTKKKLFLGDLVKIQGVMPNGIDHMSGVAVYPWNLHQHAPSIFNNNTAAWDIASGRQVVNQMAQSDLIQHDWVADKKWRRDVVTKDLVRTGVVVYHPDKKGVLFDDGLDGGVSGVSGEPKTGFSFGPLNHTPPSPPEDPEVERLKKLVGELMQKIESTKPSQPVVEVKAKKRGRPKKVKMS